MLRSGPMVWVGSVRLGERSSALLKEVPDGFVQKFVCWIFGMTVIGQLWIWPLALLVSTQSLLFAAIFMGWALYIWGPGAAACENHAWGAPWRSAPIWKHMANYFNAKLIKTAELDPQGRYVLACYPHGISAISGWVCLVTDAAGWSHTFKGISTWGMTLASNFKCPLLREYCMLHGLRSCSRRSCLNILSRPGNAIVLFPGGAAEALKTEQGCYNLILAKRRGFIRIALQSGASVVPVLCFGETQLFETWLPIPGSWMSKAQAFSHRHWGTSQPIFRGTGLFSTSGLLPLRRELATVVGAPLPPPAWEGAVGGESFEAAVQAYHQQYMEAVKVLFDQWKEKCDPGRVSDMRVIE